MTKNPWAHNKMQNLHRKTTKNVRKEAKGWVAYDLPRKVKKSRKRQMVTIIYIGEMMDALDLNKSEWQIR